MRHQYRLDIQSAGAVSPLRQQTYDGDERLDVRDLSTRVTVRVSVRDISPYRHTLLLDGKEFRILNVVRQH
jgi:hypothetical protein